MDSLSFEKMDVRSVVEAVETGNQSNNPHCQLESLCMRCGQNGTTTFLLTVIPNFRKILLSAFECSHCGEKNNEVQFAGEIQPKGCCYTLQVPSGDKKMFSRQVIKSETTTIKIPELEFEIPPEAQHGSLSTVEGILLRAAEEIGELQEERKKVEPETAEAIDKFLIKLKACASGEAQFTFVLDDPAGNGFIENPYAPSPDPSLIIKIYERTPEQQATLGYVAAPSQEPGQSQTANDVTQMPREAHGSVGLGVGRRAIAEGNSEKIAEALFRYSAPEEVMTFPSPCGTCSAACEGRMFVTNIPYFKEVIVMASSCDFCGYRSSEVKPGGGISKKGKKIVLHVKNMRDLSRDVIKSDTASVEIPDLELELAPGTLGGVVTTVEGLISQIGEKLESSADSSCGDSMEESRKGKWKEFHTKLDKLKRLEEPWTLIIDDAVANSFISPATDDVKDDDRLTFEEYERSCEQNEELGLNDMDTSSADAAYNTESKDQ